MKFEQVRLGRLLDSGAIKDVFDCKDYPDRVVAVARSPHDNDIIAEELKYIRQLKKLGYPVVEVYNDYVLNLRAGYVMKRYAFSDRSDFVTRQRHIKLYNETAKSCLESIAKKLIDDMIVIDDIQFLYDFDGRVVIADPMELISSFSYHDRVEMFETLAVEIGLCKAALANPGASLKDLENLSDSYMPKIDVRLV